MRGIARAIPKKIVRRCIKVPVLYDLCNERRYVSEDVKACVYERLRSVLAGSRLEAGAWVWIRDTKRSAIVVVVLDGYSTAVVVVGEKRRGV